MEGLLLRFLCVCLISVFLIVPAHLAVQLTPDDEGSTVLDDFLSKLEDRTGLSNIQPNYTIKGITDCTDTVTECTVNPNGTVIWDVRSKLYELHMIQGASNTSESLDGCLMDQNSKEVASKDTYNDCMKRVRNNMISYLDNEFETEFRAIINSNCSLVRDNCA